MKKSTRSLLLTLLGVGLAGASALVETFRHNMELEDAVSEKLAGLLPDKSKEEDTRE